MPLTTSIQFELSHLCISGGRIPQVAGAREMCLAVGAVVRIGELLPIPQIAALSPACQASVMNASRAAHQVRQHLCNAELPLHAD